MLSRVVRHKWLRRGLLGSTGLTATAVAASHSENDTVQTAVRASRLAGTALLMVWDYQAARLLGSASSASDAQSHVEACQQRLAERQAAYTKATHDHLPMAERVQAKQHEKQAMIEAAEQLAAAQAAAGNDPVHTKAATRLLRLCQTNRGAYIKVGQHLATLDFLVPAEYTQVLRALYDDNPRTSPQHVAEIIQQEFDGQRPEDLFDEFDYTPIASASLAQVHVAVRNGRKLAVKVQHYGIQHAASDIHAMARVSDLAESLFPQQFTWGWIMRELEPLLPKELDFLNEGRNAERAADNLRTVGLAQHCKIPAVWWDRSTARVLTMDFEPGCKATDTAAMEAAGLDKKQVATLISNIFASQIFLSHWVHCDPHPANCFVRPNARTGRPEIVLLDHGLYRQLEPDFVLVYARLWKSLLLADLPGIRQACLDLGLPTNDNNKNNVWQLFAALVTARPFDEIVERSQASSSTRLGRPKFTMTQSVDKTVMAGYAQRFLGQILQLLSVIPREMLLLLKTNDCLRHIDNALGSPTNTLAVTGRYAAMAVFRHQTNWRDRLWAWLDYVHVVMRIYLHDLLVR